MENKPLKMLIANVTGGMYVTQGNLPLNPTTGVPILSIGQLAVFNADNNKSCNASLNDGTSVAKRIYFGVGVDTNEDGAVDDVMKSPVIKVTDVVNKNQQNYTAATAEVKHVGWDVTKCNTEYGIKITFNGVNISNLIGYHELSKSFATTTGCCEDCNADCDEDSYSCVKLLDELISLINADPDGFVTASKTTSNDFAKQTITVAAATYTTGAVSIDLRPLSATGTANVIRLSGPYATGNAAALEADIQAELDNAGYGGVVTVAEVSTNYEITIVNTLAGRFGIGAHATTAATADSAATSALASPTASDDCPKLILTVNNPALKNFCRIPTNLVTPSGFTMNITGWGGFDCNLSVASVTALVYEQGNKYVIKSMEEEATGFNEAYDQYRYTAYKQPDPSVRLYTDTSATGYDLFSLEFKDVHSTTSGGFDTYASPIQLRIAVKSDGTTTTRTNLATVFSNL